MNNFDNINLFANLKDEVILKYLGVLTDDNHKKSSEIISETNKKMSENNNLYNNKIIKPTIKSSKEEIEKLKSNYNFMANKSNLGTKITEIKDTNYVNCVSVCDENSYCAGFTTKGDLSKQEKKGDCSLYEKGEIQNDKKMSWNGKKDYFNP